MNRKLVLIIPIFAMLPLSSIGQNQKMTVNEIWENYVSSFGEKEIVENIKTFSSTTVIDSENGKTVGKIKIKYPDKVYFEIEYPNDTRIVFIVNGDTGIVKTSTGVETLSKDYILEFQRMALIFPELHYQRLGYEIMLMNDTVVDGTEVFNIAINTDNGIINYQINKKNYQTFRTEINGEINEIIETKVVGGVRLITKSKKNNGQNSLIGNVIEYELNGNISDDYFDLNH